MQGNEYEFTDTHVDIYHGFVSFVKWSTISIVVLLILMAIFLL
ncbi:aa3-type cytochrome c oxidase subunit IV [Thalassospira sp. MA62]|nr:aa3-type cytochrome c oxidase subunit IV [Thalassospira sp. MA62]